MTMVAAGVLLGIAGSLHCVAMCGPLVAAVVPGSRGRAAVVYHGARLATYGILGLAAGLLGQVVALAGFGRALSVVGGLLVLLAASNRVRPWLRVGAVPGLGIVLGRLARRARATWAAGSLAGFMVAGALNALLPCGLVYAALTAAATEGDAGKAMIWMLAFGVGTVPALVVASTMMRTAARAAGPRARFVTPVALAALGLLLTVRGVWPDARHHHHHVATEALSCPSCATR